MEPPSMIVRFLHSIPHVNITLHHVNSTFNPTSSVYVESLGILASIPAALLILSLVGLLLYLLTRCCDRKPRNSKSQSCQKCTLITMTLFCCAAIGLGLYGNDDFHNGILQSLSAGRQIKGMIQNFTNKTEQLKMDIRSKVLMSDMEETFEKPTFNQTGLKILLDNLRVVRENTVEAVGALEVLYLTRPAMQTDSLKQLLITGEKYEAIRWPATLGFLTVLLLLCTILVIGVARSSRCALIFFSVFGLFGVVICWLLSGVYLASSVALSDFCMAPNEYLCKQVDARPDVNYLNCDIIRHNFLVRLGKSKEKIDLARVAFKDLTDMSRVVFPKLQPGNTTDPINRAFTDGFDTLVQLLVMLERPNVDRSYALAMRGICNGGILGLSLMMLASLVSAFILTVLVCVDSHTWIYLSKRRRRPFADKSETTPFLNSSAASPTQPVLSGASTMNRTLLHHQQQSHDGPIPASATSTLVAPARNGLSAIRGLAYTGDSPPPDYNIVVHDSRLSTSGHHTLGRLPSQQLHASSTMGPNNGKYATLSKQCKTLQDNDFY